MGKKSKTLVLTCLGIAVIVTILFYLFTFKNIFTLPIRWISLGFLLLAEAILIIKAAKTKGGFFGVATINTSIVHIAFVLVLSLVFVNVFLVFIKTYIFINIIALVILFIIDIWISNFNNYITEKNNALDKTQKTFKSCYILAQNISTEYSNSKYIKELNNIAEELRYSDDTVLTGAENKIISKLSELKTFLDNEEENANDINKLLKEIIIAIKTRTLDVNEIKRGSF